MPFQWAKQIVPAAEMTEGPYYGHGGPDRSDIREGLPGLDFHLTIKVIDIASGGPLAGLKVDLWHCDAQGYYSGYQFDPDGQPLSVEYQLPSNDESYLRGSQTTNAAGLVTFLTLFPGWYATRTPHIHFKVFTGEACILTSQLYLPEQSLGHVYATQADYYRKVERDTFNKTDIVLAKAPSRSRDAGSNFRRSPADSKAHRWWRLTSTQGVQGARYPRGFALRSEGYRTRSRYDSSPDHPGDASSRPSSLICTFSRWVDGGGGFSSLIQVPAVLRLSAGGSRPRIRHADASVLRARNRLASASSAKTCAPFLAMPR